MHAARAERMLPEPPDSLRPRRPSPPRETAMNAPERRYTVAEYLAFERRAATRHEYLDGRVYAMSPGGSPRHARIAARVIGILYGRLPTGCQLFTGDLRVHVDDTGLYTYPDVSVACGEPRFADVHALLNPTLLVEVLSPSTERYDRGDKFAHYRRIPSLREYLLIEQDRAHAELFARDGDRWILHEADGLDAVLPLASLGGTLALADVYGDVEFPADRPRSRGVREVPVEPEIDREREPIAIDVA